MVETKEKEKKIGGKLTFLDVFGWDKNFTGNLKNFMPLDCMKFVRNW